MNKTLITFLISMVPVVELRGAIPYGFANGVNPVLCFILSVIGNLLPVPFVILFIRKIFEWAKRKDNFLKKPVLWLEAKAERKKGNVLKYEFWGLMVLVAIPLPGTGAWTGALVAAMLDMQLKRALPSIVLGVIAAGIVVTLATVGVIAII